MSLRRTRRALLGLDLFLGCTAVAGGVALLLGWLAPPLDLLQGSPFADYTVPALLVIVVVGGCGLSAAWLVRHRMGAGVGASAVTGCAILCFEAVEISVIGFSALQVVYAAVGVLILGTAARLWSQQNASGAHAPTPSPQR